MKLRNNTGPVKWILILLVSLFLAVFLILPLVYILMTALGKGFGVYRASITDPYAVKALLLTLKATLWAVTVNTIFGIAAAWCLTKYAFRGKKIISTLIDLPVTVSPIIAGLIYVLTFGRQSFLYPILDSRGIQIIFAVPGIILATIFVTFPFISRELREGLCTADFHGESLHRREPVRIRLCNPLRRIRHRRRSIPCELLLESGSARSGLEPEGGGHS